MKAGEYMNQYLVSSAVRYGDNTKIRFLSENAPEDDAVNVKPDLEDVYLYVFGG